MHNTISLHYLDKNWRTRGYANNIHLIVDFDSQKYRKIINYILPSFGANRLEVKRKSNIEDYIKYLKDLGFSETDDEILR